ncbi:hypothetical protein Tdes44962_MAKER09530 [Teratosphaeria destructans]|uniref:Uncharacterized protein n=1 Tax=Teratosphaeria destructans TaxID=418781 RepID=A0A9W7W314_9PEZI|nr:hypothetical protein Tdes44962_MAKER09530 [Teratosphaeria destructans]
MHGLDGLCQGGEIAYGAEHVVHQRPAAGADLDEHDAVALAALGDPFGDDPDADEFAEDLGDLGGGDKVAFGAELVAGGRGVCGSVVAAEVAGEALAHEGGDGDGAGGLMDD